VEDTPQLFGALLGLYRFYGGGGNKQAARELTEQLYSLAQRAQDSDLLLEAHMARGTILMAIGDPVAARSHLEEGIALYDPHQHRSHILRFSLDPGAVCLSRASWVLWLLGYPDQALRRSQEALALAHALAHPHNLTIRQMCAAMFHLFRRESQAARTQVEAAITLSPGHASRQYQAAGTILQGWCLAEQGRGAEGVAQMQQGLAAYRATGTEMYRPYYLALLADGYGKAGRAEEGLRVLAEALAAVEGTGERWWEAELHRLKGELLLACAGSRQRWLEAEGCFQQACEVARHQQARSLELRAAASLSRLWQRQGKRTAARQRLADVYGWFAEGFDTADLQEANALLAECS
jgi:predicted ATPase